MKNTSSSPALGWVWRVSGRSKLWVLFRTLVRIGQSAIAILYAHALGRVVDAAASGDKAFFTREFTLFGIYTVSSIVLLLINRYLMEKGKNAVEKSFRLRFFSQLLHRDFGQVSRVHNGEWMTRITSDADVIVNAVSQIVPETVSSLVRVLAALAALYAILPQIIWILLPGGLLMAGVSVIFQNRMKHHHRQVQGQEGILRSFLQERLYSLLVIHAFTQETHTCNMADDQYDRLNKARMRRHRFVLFCNGALAGAMVTAQLLGVGMCGVGILRGTITYGAVSTVLYLVNMLENPLNAVSGYISQYYGMIASAERMMEIEQFHPDMDGEPVSPQEIKAYYAEDFASIGVENAVFAYEDGDDVLQNFSLDIPKGRFVAFTGESGCGKSTTLKILLSLYPLKEGKVYRRNTDGTQYPLDASWRGLFAYVPQGNHLISGTIRQSLTFGDPELMKQEENIRRALEIACADGFVDELPEGLDTVLGERGSSLSEGQVQRLAVARAILSERPVLLLDEATSALDGPTEEQLLKNLRTMTDRTVLIITHREAALNICDAQVRFQKG